MNPECKAEFLRQLGLISDYLSAHRNAEGAAATVLPLLATLENVKNGLVHNPDLIFDLISPGEAKIGAIPQNVEFFANKIDDTQGLAVKKALAMDNLLLVQGPPGAGKTTMIVEMVRQILARHPNARILLTSQSHAAVDNAVERLILEGLGNRICRVKERDTTPDEIKKINLESIVENTKKNWSNDPHFACFLEEFKDEKADFCNTFIAKNIKGFGISRGVLATTINSVSSGGINLWATVDYAIVDEVGKANMAEVLRIASVTDKLILIGDPNQLPAVLKEEPKDNAHTLEVMEELSEHPFTTFLYDNANPAIKVMLNKQYRMCNRIGDLVANHFYTENGKRLLFNGLDRPVEDALHFVSYDTRNEIVNNQTIAKNRDRRENHTEAKIALLLLRQLLRTHRGDDIAIITPYVHQVALIREEVEKAGLPLTPDRINTVDSFQGSEAKTVIFCCVRNAGQPTLYFTKPNRLNVALSRAIDHIYLIGGTQYVRQVDALADYINGPCVKEFFNGTAIVPAK